MALSPNSFKVGSIQTADPVSPDAFRSLDAMLNGVFDKLGNDAIEAARGVYKKSKTLEVNSTKYSQTDDFEEQMNLADGMVASYNDLKGDLSDLMNLFSQEEGPAKTKTTEKRSELKEDHISLDSLIESIINKKLPK